MVQALADDGHRVTLVAFAERAELLGDLEPLRTACAEIDLVPTPLGPRGRGRDALKRLRALASPLPFGAWKFRSPSRPFPATARTESTDRSGPDSSSPMWIATTELPLLMAQG